MTLGSTWALAVVAVVGMGLLAVASFPNAPAPGEGTVTYFRDYGWHLALAAEAKNHWPIMDPNVSGEPLPYHYFVHIHMAAASQVTGIDLPLIYFRFLNLPLVLLVVLLYVTAGLSFARSAWVGIAAATMALLVGDLQLETTQEVQPFLGVFVSFLVSSPSFLFGLAAFLALVVTVGERITRTTNRPGDWILVAVLAVGASNAKVTILPLLLVALTIFAVWKFIRERRIHRPVLVSMALLLVVGLATYLSQYAGHSSGLRFGPFATFDRMPAVSAVKDYLAGLVDAPLEGVVLGAGGVLVGFIGLLAGMIALLAWARISQRSETVWLLALLLGGLLSMFLLEAPGTGNELYFLFYGIAAGWLAAAFGIRRLWMSRPMELALGKRAALIFAGWLVLLLIVMRAPFDLSLFSGDDAEVQTLIFSYGGLAITLILLLLAVRKWLTPVGWWTGASICAALLLVGTIGTFSNYVAPAFRSNTEPTVPTPESLTPARFDALTWIRDHTEKDSVIAVNGGNPYNFNYSAFAERSAFLQGWAYTRASLRCWIREGNRDRLCRTLSGAGCT